MSKYIEFQNARYPTFTGKTVVIDVVSKTQGNLLGRIKWLGRWRQYAFFPSNDTVFNPTCMNDISEQIKDLMKDRNKK